MIRSSVIRHPPSISRADEWQACLERRFIDVDSSSPPLFPQRSRHQTRDSITCRLNASPPAHIRSPAPHPDQPATGQHSSFRLSCDSKYVHLPAPILWMIPLLAPLPRGFGGADRLSPLGRLQSDSPSAANRAHCQSPPHRARPPLAPASTKNGRRFYTGFGTDAAAIAPSLYVYRAHIEEVFSSSPRRYSDLGDRRGLPPRPRTHRLFGCTTAQSANCAHTILAQLPRSIGPDPSAQGRAETWRTEVPSSLAQVL